MSTPKTITRQLTYFLVTVFLTFGLSLSLQSLLAAWTAPTANPPADNLLPPIYNETTLDPNNYAAITKNLSLQGNFTLVDDSGSTDHKMLFNFTSDGKRLYIAPWDEGAWQWGREFGYNTTDNYWYVENGLKLSSGNLILNNNWLSGDGGNEGIYIDNNGNVGIGTTNPNYKLDVAGGIRVDDYIRARDSGGLALRTDEGTTRLFIKDNGNVGIGTTNPGRKLDVNGYVKGSGLCIGNDCRTSWSSGGGFKWGDLCRSLSGEGGDTLCCHSNEYLVDVWVSDEGSDGELVPGHYGYISRGYGGCVHIADPSGYTAIGILCCKDP